MIGILSVDKNWRVSVNGAYVYKIKSSLKNFKEYTTNRVVVMDKEMIESLPKKQALKNRINICFTEEKSFSKEGFVVANSKDQLFELLGFYSSENVFLIGSGEFCKELLPYCEKFIISKFDGDVKCNNQFIDLDKEKNWKLISTSNPFFEDEIMFYTCEYKNICPKKYNYGYEREELI